MSWRLLEIKKRTPVSDILMISKAGNALKHRGYHYYRDWRPLSRSWEHFCSDLIVAIPDRENPRTRAHIAATLNSRDCGLFSDYEIQKLRSKNRFYYQLPWNIILSMVEYGLEHTKARSAIRLQKPLSERVWHPPCEIIQNGYRKTWTKVKGKIWSEKCKVWTNNF